MAPAAQHGYYFEDLSLGMAATHVKTITEADIVDFAAISGDYNPVHMDEDYAATTIFKRRIAHGILSAGLISAVFGMQLPGPGCIYVTQTLNFKAPVRIGDEVVARVECQELLAAKNRAVFLCECTVRERRVLEGEAILMVPARPIS